jgi:DNA-binding response OmpR family regulator
MNKKRILLVDDEKDLRKLLKYRLESMGYEITEACDGEEGLNEAKTGNHDLIILDLMLPKIDGLDVCRILKDEWEYKNIPIIMFTAKSQDEDKGLGMKTGADAYITKPFEPEILIGKIKELLGRGKI